MDRVLTNDVMIPAAGNVALHVVIVVKLLSHSEQSNLIFAFSYLLTTSYNSILKLSSDNFKMASDQIEYCVESFS